MYRMYVVYNRISFSLAGANVFTFHEIGLGNDVYLKHFSGLDSSCPAGFQWHPMASNGPLSSKETHLTFRMLYLITI